MNRGTTVGQYVVSHEQPMKENILVEKHLKIIEQISKWMLGAGFACSIVVIITFLLK